MWRPGPWPPRRPGATGQVQHFRPPAAARGSVAVGRSTRAAPAAGGQRAGGFWTLGSRADPVGQPINNAADRRGADEPRSRLGWALEPVAGSSGGEPAGGRLVEVRDGRRHPRAGRGL
jgi:hypothetical protein